MNIEIIPFKKELLEGFIYNGTENQVSGSQIAPMVEFYARSGYAYMALGEDKKILGIGGFYPLWPGMASCWLLLNKEAKIHKTSLFKNILEVMHKFINDFKITDMIANCLDNSQEANNLIAHLGFTKNREYKMAFYSRR